MEDYHEEGRNKKYPIWVSLEKTEEIIKQMKEKVCKIKVMNEKDGSGFFLKLKIRNQEIKLLITNNHVINEEILNTNQQIKLYINNNKYNIKLDNKMKYTSKKYDITLIEINEDDEINCNYFNYKKIDTEDLNSLYILHYPLNENVSASYGIIQYLKDINYQFIHYCSTIDGSSGSPIINLESKEEEVIGIHFGTRNNHNLGTFINYPINEFIEQYEQNKLREFNEKYNLDIKFNATELDLSWRDLNFKKNFFYYLPNLKEVKKLNLCGNLLSDISFLENLNLEKLEVLNLGCNKIQNIKILENINFKELKELNLYQNGLSDISFLENGKFKKLEILNLGENKIQNIKILENVNFKGLKKLNLERNYLSDISFLENKNFEKLEVLNLGYNKIQNIKILENINFKELKELNLYHNYLSDIFFLKNENFKKLEVLNLGENTMQNIKILENVNFKELKKLCLVGNNLSDISFLENLNFEKLEELYLSNNNIKNCKVLENVNFKGLKILDLGSNNISNISFLENVKFEKLQELCLCNNKSIYNYNILENCNFKHLEILDLSGNYNIPKMPFFDKLRMSKNLYIRRDTY